MIPPLSNSSVDYPSNLVFQNEIGTPHYMPNCNIQQQQPFFQYQQYSQNAATEVNTINAAHTAGRSLPPLSHLLPDKANVKNDGVYNNDTRPVSQENNNQTSSDDLEVTINHASSSVVNSYYQNMNNEIQQTYNNTSGAIAMDQVNPYVAKTIRGKNEKHHQQHQYHAHVLMSPENTFAINNRNRLTAPSMVSSDGSDHHQQQQQQQRVGKNTSQSPVVSNDISLNLTHSYTSPSASYYDNMNSQTTDKLVQMKYDYPPYGPADQIMSTTSLSLTHTSNNNSTTTWPDYTIQNSHPNNQNQVYEDYQKVYSFVPLAGPTQKKRPRRKFHEVERLYQCNYPNCTKSYGTLNHLNAHITMQEHGPKRLPGEFKDLRKHLRKLKSEQQKKDKMEDYLERLETYDRDPYN